MSNDRYAPVQPGSHKPPRAAVWNDLVRMYQDYERGLGITGGAAGLARNCSTALVRNNSGADVDRFKVIGLDDDFEIVPSSYLEQFRERPLLKGVAPDERYHRGRFGITIDALKDGKIGPVVVSGIVPCLLDVTASTEGARFASLVDGDGDKLVCSYAGMYPILAIESGTGDKWGLVDISGSPTRFPLAKITTGIAKNATGNVTMLKGTFGSEIASTETVADVLNRYGTLSANAVCHLKVDAAGVEIGIATPC